MAFLRMLTKIVLLILWSLLLIVPALLSYIGLSKWQRVRRGAFWAQKWARGASRIVGVKTRIHGDIPDGTGVLLVSNHLGYLDILAHAANFRIRFTPNDGIKHWFFAGFLVGLSCPIWIDRKHPRKAASYAEVFRQTMDNGVSLLVYPEGTSSDGKHGLLPFKSTVFSSVSAGEPIVPMVIFYREDPKDGESAAWFDDTSFACHGARVLKKKKIEINLYILPAMYAGENEDRKSLAARVRAAMTKEYEKHANLVEKVVGCADPGLE